MESLGTSLIEALMILVEFMPILFGLSIGIPIFFFGDWDYGLIVGALIWSVGGTIFLILLGLILAFKAFRSSPSETTSAPDPNFANSDIRDTFELDLTEKQINGFILLK